jgi:hypothetical protein
VTGIAGWLAVVGVGAMATAASAGSGHRIPAVTIDGAATTTICFVTPAIRKHIRRHVEQIRYCYERQLQSHPRLAGTVSATFTIAGDGTVTSSAATGVDDEVSTCIAKVIAQIQFSTTDGPSIVHYPFELRPVVVREDLGVLPEGATGRVTP